MPQTDLKYIILLPLPHVCVQLGLGGYWVSFSYLIVFPNSVAFCGLDFPGTSLQLRLPRTKSTYLCLLTAGIAGIKDFCYHYLAGFLLNWQEETVLLSELYCIIYSLCASEYLMDYLKLDFVETTYFSLSELSKYCLDQVFFFFTVEF